jgi:hypothetical protein
MWCICDHDELAGAASSAGGMLVPDLIEPRKGALNVAEDKARSASLDLDVNPVTQQHQLDIFVVLDNDMCHTRSRRLEQARGGVKVLVEEGAMNSLDASQLAGI